MTTVTDNITKLFEAQKAYAPTVNNSDVKERIKKLKSIKAYITDPANENKLIKAIRHDLKRPLVEVLVGLFRPLCSEPGLEGLAAAVPGGATAGTLGTAFCGRLTIGSRIRMRFSALKAL